MPSAMGAERPPGAGQPYPKVCFSFAAYAKNVINHLKSCQIPVIQGLSDDEFGKIERTFNFAFPPDLRAILREGLPVGVGFPDWRSSTVRQLQMMFDIPMAGIIYGVAKGQFWHDAWGPRPDDADRATVLLKEKLRLAPVLVPIYSHCYIPSRPEIAGNPVFFIHDAEFYYSGFDVADFFQREVFVPLGFRPENDLVPSRFSIIDDRSSPDKPELGVRSAGNSPRKPKARMVSRYKYFNGDRKQVMPTNELNRFTMEAPAWVAKAARRIDFWSDLVEGAERPVAGPKKEGWFEEYLTEMEGRLRRGGWNDEEIREMVGVEHASVRANKPMQASPDREILASSVRLLSATLCEAGWSERDVGESLGLFEDRSVETCR